MLRFTKPWNRYYILCIDNTLCVYTYIYINFFLFSKGTISIAKGGIITTLNARCSVLAAANSVFGRWDDSKGAENMDFMPSLLSRFDNIFIIQDRHDQLMDIKLAKHVIGVHTNNIVKQSQSQFISRHENEILDRKKPDAVGGVILPDLLKRYIHYCRKRCAPRLTREAATKLGSVYVNMRSEQSSTKGRVYITIRQLESIIRFSEALAKLQLKAFATEDHVNEAIRLFKISTLTAMTHLQSATTTMTETDREIADLLESQLMKRLSVGSSVTEANIMQEFKMYPVKVIAGVVASLLRRRILRHERQRKFLYRVAN